MNPECKVIGCARPAQRRQLCHTHDRRMRHGVAPLIPIRGRRSPQSVIEDMEWLAGTDTPERIATRLGFASWPTLEQLLWRHSRQDLAAAIRARRELPKLGPWQVVA